MSKQEPKKRVGIWLRVSTDQQTQGESPEHHEKRARMFADLKEWDVVEIYDLCGVSGKSVIDHPECERMYRDVKQGKISGLIFSKLARLGRNTQELISISEYFKEHDADLISLHESIDTSSPAGRLFFTVIAALAQFEREEISDRAKAAVPIRAKLGKSMGGKPPYGYQYVDHKMVPHPEEAPIRKMIYELFVETPKKRAVARTLNERGYRTRTGSKWSDNAIDRILKDTTAKGIHIANRYRSGGKGKAAILKPASEWIERVVPAIISVELWERCNALIEANSTGPVLKRRPAEHLLSGKLYCVCGSKMYVRGRTAYKCRGKDCKRRIPIDDIDAIFFEQLKGFTFSDEEIAGHLADASDMMQQKKNELVLLSREMKKLQKEMDGLYQLYIDGNVKSDSFARRNRPLEERFNQLEDEIPSLEAQIDHMKNEFLNREEVNSEARNLASKWEQLDFQTRRTLVETIVDRITVGKGEIELALLYFPSGNFVKNATNPQGFMAATSCIRDGYEIL